MRFATVFDGKLKANPNVNLLMWMVVGMIIGCTVQVVGRARDELAIIGGLFAGAAGALLGGALATDLTVAMQLFGQSISMAGLLAAVAGATGFSAVSRLLWRRRSHHLIGPARAPFAAGEAAAVAAGSAQVSASGDTEPAVFEESCSRSKTAAPASRGAKNPVQVPTHSGPLHDH
jgi:uncharacterized membrane protein YeaQ/YmgE (transglycosylase-associated protein family)